MLQSRQCHGIVSSRLVVPFQKPLTRNRDPARVEQEFAETGMVSKVRGMIPWDLANSAADISPTCLDYLRFKCMS